MKRLASLFAVAAVTVFPSFAQQPVSSFKVTPSLIGVAFYVDGTEYRNAAVFLWPKGSKHELRFIPNQVDGTWLDDNRTSKFTFGGWSDNTGLLAGAGGND